MKTPQLPLSYTIRFPDWYGDPRDFHDFILKTYLESHKLKLAHTKKSKSLIDPKLLYLPIKKDMIGTRYAALALSYLLHTDYQYVCIIVADYNVAVGLLQQASKSLLCNEFQDLAVSPAYPRSKSVSLPLDSINDNYGHLFSALACIAPIKNLFVTTVGGRILPKNKKIDIALIQDYIAASKCKQDNACCVFVGDFDMEQDYPIMGTYFEGVAQMLDRKPRAVEFATDIGDMLVQVA